MPIFFCCAMEQQLPELDHDVRYLIKQEVFNTSKKYVIPPSDMSLSCNYIELIDNPALKGQLATVELQWDSVYGNYYFKFQDNDGNKKDIILNKNHPVRLFDGPNQNGIVITDCGWYCCDENSSPQEKVMKSNDRRRCWCGGCNIKGITPKFIAFSIIDHTKHIDGLALNKKSDFCAVAYHSQKYNKILFFTLRPDKISNKIEEVKIPLSNDNYCKKICFLTDKTLLMLNKMGDLSVIALKNNEKEETTLYQQCILDNEKKPVKVRNFSVDMSNPTQMIMELENNSLVLGNLKRRCYRPLLHNITFEAMSFNNDTIAFKTLEEDNYTYFNLLFIILSMKKPSFWLNKTHKKDT